MGVKNKKEFLNSTKYGLTRYGSTRYGLLNMVPPDMVNQIWLKHATLHFFFHKNVPKSWYSHEHILWKIMKTKGYNIVNLDFYEVVLVRNTPHPNDPPKNRYFLHFLRIWVSIEKKTRISHWNFLRINYFQKLSSRTAPPPLD